MNTPSQTRIPQVQYELVVFGTSEIKLVVNPSCITYVERGPDFTLDKFLLPSTRIDDVHGSGDIHDVYNPFREMLTEALTHTLKTDSRYSGMPQSDALKKLVEDYTRAQLQGSATLLEKLDDAFISGFKGNVLAGYDCHRLPRRAYGAKQDLTDEERGMVADQLVEHLIVERVSLPVRRVYGLYTMHREDYQVVMEPVIREFITRFNKMIESGSLHILATKKALDFAAGLDGMLNKGHEINL